MPTLKLKCDNCDGVFTVIYNEEQCEDDPSFCTFCAEPLFFDDDAVEDE
jgi:hypothetical protein